VSRYDYRDPGTDPAYCAGLEPELLDDDPPPCRSCGGALIALGEMATRTAVRCRACGDTYTIKHEEPPHV
jgi:hypothetical protein